MAKLKDIAVCSSLIEVRKKSIDALAAYGLEAIIPITEVVQLSSTEEVRVHGLDTIKKLKESE